MVIKSLRNAGDERLMRTAAKGFMADFVYKSSSNVIIGVAGHQINPGSTDVCKMISIELFMTKYCLALTSPQHSDSHVRVGEFGVAERAFELAGLIALELGIEDDGKWLGWTVEVRSPQGQRLFAAPVAGGEL
jgi:hypothetical protein